MSMKYGQRGPHPADHQLFAAAEHAKLCQAVADQSWLLSREYAPTASLKLVGDHYHLRERQRLAVARSACSEQQQVWRQQSGLPWSALTGRELWVDGFNLIVTVEAALAGGVLLHCQDGCWRDLSSVHGSYRTVATTEAALRLIGETLWEAQPSSVIWLLDQPVSNSGRLAQRLRSLAATWQWPWQVAVTFNPDKEICAASDVAVTADSNILDHVKHWFNLTDTLLKTKLPSVWAVELRP